MKYFHLDNNEEESEGKEKNDLILKGINDIMSEIKEINGRLDNIEGKIDPTK